MDAFDIARVERMTRDIIGDFGLPIELVTVIEDGDTWRVVVRDASHRVLDVPCSRTSDARQLREQLTARLMEISS